MFHDDAQKTARSLIALAAQAREKAQPKRRSDRTKAQRNLAIFKKVAVEHCTHDEVAHAFKLHRSRVTQIVTAMRQQLAGAAPDDPDALISRIIGAAHGAAIARPGVMLPA